jgi:hypothetical protein
MGGLCIRKYLQRRSGGVPRWWVEPSAVDGHMVARVVTFGTPHFGSNASIFVPMMHRDQQEEGSHNYMMLVPLAPNTSSEAVRDGRYSYAIGSQAHGVYLFGGNEAGLNTNVLLSGWHNADVDFNGSDKDVVRGINEELARSMPLPTDIRYTWITSSIGAVGSGDKGVCLERQRMMTVDGRAYPVGLADTLLANRAHWTQTGDATTIARGLDEPGVHLLAYEVELDRTYRGGITMQSNGVMLDYDLFRIAAPPLGQHRRILKIKLRDLSASPRSLRFAIITDSAQVIVDTTGYFANGVTLTVGRNTSDDTLGVMFISVAGYAIPAGLQPPYEFIAWLEDVENQPPRLSMIADTALTVGTAISVPFTVDDEDLEKLALTVYSTSHNVLDASELSIDGTGRNRTLRIASSKANKGQTTIAIVARDEQYTSEVSFKVRVDDATAVYEPRISSNQPILSLSPFPASHTAHLVVESLDPANLRIEMISNTGEILSVIYQGTLPNGIAALPIPLSQFPSGIYGIKVANSDTVQYRHLMIVKQQWRASTYSKSLNVANCG